MPIFSLLFFFFKQDILLHSPINNASNTALQFPFYPCGRFVWPFIRVEAQHPTHKSTHKYHQTNLSEVLEAYTKLIPWENIVLTCTCTGRAV